MLFNLATNVGVAVHVETEIAIIVLHLAIHYLDNLLAGLAEEPPIVGDDHYSALVFSQGKLQSFLHGHIQVIRWLIENQHARRNEHHPDNCQSRFFATRQVADLHVHSITAEAELLHDLLQLLVSHQNFIGFLDHLPTSLVHG